MTAVFHRWVCKPRVLVSVVVLSLVYYVVFMGGVPEQWMQRFARKRHAIDRSLQSVLNETLGFQRILVINMPERTDRRDATSLAAAVSKMKIEFVKGVRGDSIPEDAFPPDGSPGSIKLSNGIKGSWRSHMNALQQVVHQNLSTALIFEDDVDWDIRIRPQLQAFALASRWLTDDPETAKHITSYPISVTNNPEKAEESIHNTATPNPFARELFSIPLPTVMQDVQHRNPKISPYGDPENWDVLWLGHCGVGFPRSPKELSKDIGRHNVLLQDPNDPTVPMPRYLRAHPFGPLDPLGESHPPHTRVYHRASGGALCTVAYAVSQRGARRLLHEFGVKKWSRIWDVELGDWCASDDFSHDIDAEELPTPSSPEEEYDVVFEGEIDNSRPAHDGPPKPNLPKPHDEASRPAHDGPPNLDLATTHDDDYRPAHDGPPSHERPDGSGQPINVLRRGRISEDERKRGQRKCITSQPPIFAHHHPLGGESNIGGLGGGYARDVQTKYVRLSTRMNLEALLRGDPDETLVDQWPD